MRIIKVLFLEEPADRSDAEQRLVMAMPRTIKAAACAPLQGLLEPPLKETASQVKTLGEGLAILRPRMFQFLREGKEGRETQSRQGRRGVGLVGEEVISFYFKCHPSRTSSATVVRRLQGCL